MDGHQRNQQWAEAAALSAAMIVKARRMAADAEEAIRAARQMRGLLTPLLEQMAQSGSDGLSKYRHSILTSVVETAMEVTGADMANLQVVDPASSALHIEAQRGFRQPFLDFFDCVYDASAVCGLAFKSHAQVIVEDVAESPVFLGSPALEVVLDAGVRAVQSTPLVGCSGRIVGVISTHWRVPHCPRARELRRLRLLARSTADWIEERMLLMAPQSGRLSERDDIRPYRSS